MKPVRPPARARLAGLEAGYSAIAALPGRDAAPGAANARAAILGRSGAIPANDNRAPPAGWASLENVR